MKSDTSHVRRLRNHALLYCITDLKSYKAVVTALKKIYPNLEYVALSSNTAMDQVGRDLTAAREQDTHTDILEFLGGVDSYRPETKTSESYEWDD